MFDYSHDYSRSLLEIFTKTIYITAIRVDDDAAEIEKEVEPPASLSAAFRGRPQCGSGGDIGCANVKLGDVVKSRKTLTILKMANKHVVKREKVAAERAAPLPATWRGFRVLRSLVRMLSGEGDIRHGDML